MEGRRLQRELPPQSAVSLSTLALVTVMLGLRTSRGVRAGLRLRHIVGSESERPDTERKFDLQNIF